MDGRRVLLLVLAVALVAAALLAVGPCAPEPVADLPSPASPIDLPEIVSPGASGRRRVRTDESPEPAAPTLPAARAAGIVEDELAQWLTDTTLRDEPTPDPIGDREFRVAVTGPDGRRVPGVEVLVRGDTVRGMGLSGPKGALDLHGLSRGEGVSNTAESDVSGVARVRAPCFERMAIRATSDAWHGETRVSDIPESGPIDVALAVVPGFRLSGRVVLDDGTPLPGADVYVAARLPGHENRAPRRLQHLRAGEDGRYATASLPWPETRVVECYVMAGAVAGTPLRFPVTPGAHEGVDLIVPRGGVVRGRCVDEDGKPLVGVRVRGIFPFTGEITFTDGGGRFSMKVPGAGGGLVFFVEGRVQTGRVDLRGTPEGTDIGDVLLPRGQVLAGRVVDATGAPVADASVVVVEPVSEHPAAVLRTDAEGRFRADMVGPGAHWIYVAHRAGGAPNGLVGGSRFDGFTAGTTDAELVLPRAHWATLEVRDAAGDEPRAFEIGVFTLRRLDAPTHLALHHVFETAGATRSSFPFRFPAPGTYEVELELSRTGESDRVTVTVGDEAPATIVLTPR